MNLRDLYALVVRQGKELADVRARQQRMVMFGSATEAKGAKVRLRLSEKDQGGADADFLSPEVPIGKPSGKNGGGHSTFTKAGIGEPFILISPGGEISEHSRAFHAGHTDDNPAPGSAEDDSETETYGSWKIEKKNGLRISANGISFDLTASGLMLTAGGTSFSFTAAGFEQTGGEQKHDGKDVGSTHRHGGVLPGAALTETPN